MALFQKPTPNMDYIKYICYGTEICPKTDTLHYQCYVEFKDKYSIKKCQEYMGVPNCHLETRKCNEPISARHYCLKDYSHMDCEECIKAKTNNKNGFGCDEKNNNFIYSGPLDDKFKDTNFEFIELGKIPVLKQGERIDILRNIELIKNGEIDEIEDSFLLRYPKGSEKLISKYNKLLAFKNVEKEPIINRIIYGQTGRGKTLLAINFCKENDLSYYIINPDNKGGKLWFNNYKNEKVLIIDEFDGQIPLTKMNGLLQRVPVEVETKGSTLYPMWDYVFICSNYHPLEWYKENEYVDSLLSRIDEIINIIGDDLRQKSKNCKTIKLNNKTDKLTINKKIDSADKICIDNNIDNEREKTEKNTKRVCFNM